MSLRSLKLLAATCTLACACGAPPAGLFSADEANQQCANGMSTNGLSTNGMSTNGMSTNGLASGGLQTPAFTNWFGQDVVLSEMVMRYMVRCALATGRTYSYSFGGTNYSWSGLLGLAPIWSTTGVFTLAEQQLVSACMAAHTNRFGVHVNISVRGYFADGSSIPVTSSEASTYYKDEGCYFGNLFDGTGVFSAYSSATPLLDPNTSSVRACAADNGAAGSCAPMRAVGVAQTVCSGGSVSSGYASCSYGGVNYKPVCVRLAPSIFDTCGDGICQMSETCFKWGTSGASCRADCGTCGGQGG